MECCYTEKSATSFIQQGDIIIKNHVFDKNPTIGMVITADCDVVQNKHGNKLNWIEIIPASAYIREIWAIERMRSIASKQSELACKFINITIKKTDTTIAPLSIENLQKWVKESTPQEIFSSLSINQEKNKKDFMRLEAIKVALCSTEDVENIPRLKLVYSHLERPPAELEEHIKQALNSSASGFSDFFFLPEIPQQRDEFGFVALFRHIYSLDASQLFNDEISGKIYGAPPYFYRIGTFVDRIKFSMIQKLAFLFTRIGHEDAFEKACETSVELASQDLFRRS